MSDFVYEMILSNCSDTSTFTPEILVYVIAFMLLLEFFGGIFGMFGKLTTKIGERK